MSVNVGSLSWISTSASDKGRVAIVNCDANIDTEYVFKLVGTDNNGTTVKANFITVDNLLNITPAIFTYGFISVTISPYTRTTFSIPQRLDSGKLRFDNGIISIIFSEDNLGIPDEQNQLASGNAYNMGTFVTRDGTNSMLANFNFGGFKGINCLDPINSQDVATKYYVDLVTGRAISNPSEIYATEFSQPGEVWDGIYNNTASLAAAIVAAGNANATLILPPKLQTGAQLINKPLAIKGCGGKSFITAIAGNYNMFTISSSDVTISDLFIDDTLKTGGWDFIIACGTSGFDRIKGNNINTLNSFGILTDSGTTGFHVTTIWQDIQGRSMRGPGFSMTRFFAYIWFIRCTPDYVGVATSNFTGFFFDGGGLGAGAGGLNLVDCSVLGTQGVSFNANQRGFDIRNTAAVWATNCHADTLCEIGWNLFNINAFRAKGCEASLCGSDGWRIQTVFNSSFDACHSYGRNYVSSPGAGACGVVFVSGCYNIKWSNSDFFTHTLHGVNKAAAQVGSIKFVNCLFSNNGLAGVGYGINSIGNSVFTANGCGFQGNQQGNANCQGNLDYLNFSMYNSGAVANAGPGPFTV